MPRCNELHSCGSVSAGGFFRTCTSHHKRLNIMNDFFTSTRPHSRRNFSGRRGRLNYRASARTLPSADLPEWTVTRSIPMPGDTAPMTLGVIGVLFFGLLRTPLSPAFSVLRAAPRPRPSSRLPRTAVRSQRHPTCCLHLPQRSGALAATELVGLGQQQVRGQSVRSGSTRASASRSRSAGDATSITMTRPASEARASTYGSSARASADASARAPWRSHSPADPRAASAPPARRN